MKTIPASKSKLDRRCIGQKEAGWFDKAGASGLLEAKAMNSA
jgi:hypothetical protein